MVELQKNVTLMLLSPDLGKWRRDKRLRNIICLQFCHVPILCRFVHFRENVVLPKPSFSAVRKADELYRAGDFILYRLWVVNFEAYFAGRRTSSSPGGRRWRRSWCPEQQTSGFQRGCTCSEDEDEDKDDENDEDELLFSLHTSLTIRI